MSPRAALWLLLVLPTAVHGQTPSPLPTFTPMKSFHHDQFQGEWFVLGLAGNNYRKKDKALLKPYITTIVADDKGQLQVSSAMKRGKRCDTWSYVMVPAEQPGQFTVEHKGSTADQEAMRVIDTDYTKFALMLSLRRTGSRTIIRVSLLDSKMVSTREKLHRSVLVDTWVMEEVSGFGLAFLPLGVHTASSISTEGAGAWDQARSVSYPVHNPEGPGRAAMQDARSGQDH
ncbi:PREDICTED: epididymal-specific lipocalin-12 [Dipodomys ordii]|uniref:Epididymal-specific lipocalin-12 n=1 Tax=Dipodomys ordii TaxID=10020 RepID=A0A1S3G9V0_DIPOR|nr:PREDICTED: epididymal-specific lipocalin-12 [Dipodomys ordii]